MSRAAFWVPTYGSRAAEFCAHRAAYSLLCATTSASCAALAGMSSVARYVSSCGPVMQVNAGSLAATPRGSKPTMSNRASTADGNSLRAPSAYWTPEPPGPPGLTTSAPIRRDGPAAGSFITGSENRRQEGRA